jgi:hypothetical protein
MGGNKMNGKQSKKLRRMASQFRQGQPNISLTTKDGKKLEADKVDVYKELKRAFLKGDLK